MVISLHCQISDQQHLQLKASLSVVLVQPSLSWLPVQQYVQKLSNHSPLFLSVLSSSYFPKAHSSSLSAFAASFSLCDTNSKVHWILSPPVVNPRSTGEALWPRTGLSPPLPDKNRTYWRYTVWNMSNSFYLTIDGLAYCHNMCIMSISDFSLTWKLFFHNWV